MKKFQIKFIKNNLLSFFLGAIVFGVIGVGATTLIGSDKVEYKNSKSLKSSLDELYSSASQIKYNSYTIGQKITLNNELYYVIADSDSTKRFVTLLKAEPLTVNEVNTYGAGHINRYTGDSVGTAYNNNGYGGMAYYSSATCGASGTSGCTTDYTNSEIKYVIDAWTSAKFTNGELATDNNGYKARLITVSELENLGYIYSSGYYPINDNIPIWIWNSQYNYWTMSPNNLSTSVWYVYGYGDVGNDGCVYGDGVVYHIAVLRPVINVKKSKL